MAESLQQSLRRQLLSAAAAGSAAFELSGVLELSKPLEVYFKDHNDQLGSVTFPLPGNDPTELQPLLDACSPAMFGLGRQTLHNEAVRKALQLPANKVGLSSATPLSNHAILGDIKDLMMPEAAGYIRAEPYALNVYSPDGFFKAHRDTPASPDMFGSLIFCLPTEFTGGELIIRSPDLSTSVTHDWGSTSSARLADASSSSSSGSSGCGLAWAAMYSDCEHEIKPVTTGHRVTLTYNLYSPASSGNSSSQDSGGSAAFAEAASASTARESAFGVQLAAALSDATWCPAGVTLGFVSENFYAAEPLSKCLKGGDDRGDLHNERSCNMPDSLEPDSLKGSDLQLYRAAKVFGLEVKIVPVVSLERFMKFEMKYATYDGEDEPFSPLSPGKLAVMKSFKDTVGRWGPAHIYWKPEQETWAECLKKSIAERNAAQLGGDLLWVKQPGKQHLKYCGPVEREHMGSHTDSSTCYYAAAALLLEVPPVGAPARQG